MFINAITVDPAGMYKEPEALMDFITGFFATECNSVLSADDNTISIDSAKYDYPGDKEIPKLEFRVNKLIVGTSPGELDHSVFLILVEPDGDFQVGHSSLALYELPQVMAVMKRYSFALKDAPVRVADVGIVFQLEAYYCGVDPLKTFDRYWRTGMVSDR